MSIQSLLNPWSEVRRLREENERLQNVIADPYISGLEFGKEELNFKLGGIGPQLFAGMFVGMLDKNSDVAPNFIEVTFNSKIGPVVVTIHRPYGKTPSRLLDEAKKKIVELELKLNGDKI